MKDTINFLRALNWSQIFGLVFIAGALINIIIMQLKTRKYHD